MTFEQAYEFTDKFSSSAAFEKPECEAYFQTLMSLPLNSVIAEIGLQWGRSSSIALQVAKYNRHTYIGIDPFNEDGGDDTCIAWQKMAYQAFPEHIALRACSDDVPPFSTHAILIDGFHSYEQVFRDCERFLPLIPPGGYAMLHDYGRDSLPEVYEAATRYFGEHPEWEHVRTVGTLGIWRKH